MTLALVLLSCGGPPAAAPWLSLTDPLGGAPTVAPEIFVDVGAPELRSLLTGLHPDEKAPDGTTFAWSGAEATVALALDAPEPLVLTVRAKGPGRPQRVTVRLGDTTVGELALKDDWREVSLEIAARGGSGGATSLTLLAEPIQVEGDPRSLGAAWDWVRVTTVRAATRPEPDVLAIPLGARAQVAITTPAGARLAWDAIEPSGGPLHVGWLDPGTGGWTWTPATDGGVDLPAGLGAVALGTGPSVGLALPARGDVRVRGARIEAPSGTPPPRRPPSVIVYLVDTLRADHLGCYGYERPTSPHIDAFAAEGVVYQDTLAQSPWTRASVATALSGLYPQSHGAVDRPDRLPAQIRLLPQMLRDGGFATAAFVTNGNASPKFGFDRGYDRFTYLRETKDAQVHHRAGEVHAALFAWLDTLPADRPFFAYVHVSEPHGPYTPAEPYRTRFAAGVTDPELGTLPWLRRLHGREIPVTPELPGQLIDLYDGEIAELDDAFGAFVAELKARDRYDDTVVVFTADHGEEFYEHRDWEHGQTLYGEVLDVPMILKPAGHPAWAGARSDTLATLIDVVPTVLDQVGAKIPANLEGVALDDSTTGPRAGFAHLSLGGLHAEATTEGPHKYVRWWRDSGPVVVELYDRESDFGEQTNLLATSPARALSMADALTRFTAAHPPVAGESALVDDDLAERLKALGYAD